MSLPYKESCAVEASLDVLVDENTEILVTFYGMYYPSIAGTYHDPAEPAHIVIEKFDVPDGYDQHENTVQYYLDCQSIFEQEVFEALWESYNYLCERFD